MNIKLIKKWIKALESKEYLEGHTNNLVWCGNSKDVYIDKNDGNDYFCPLGILCDILPKNIIDWKRHNDWFGKEKIYTYSNDNRIWFEEVLTILSNQTGIEYDRLEKISTNYENKKQKFSTVAKNLRKMIEV